MELAFYHNGIEYYFSPYIEEIYYPLAGLIISIFCCMNSTTTP
jgi:hypothetical protein